MPRPTLSRRRVAALFAAALTTLAAAPSFAQDGKAAPIRLIVPLSAGSTVDAIARAMSHQMARVTGHPIVVENLAGAGGVTGTVQIVRAPKDGLTLGMVSSNHVINPSIYKSMPFDALADITPIGVIGHSPLVLVVSPAAIAARTTKELIALLRTQPGRYRYGSAGAGSVLHLAGELFRAEARVDLKHIPFKGTGPLVADLSAGMVDMAFVSVMAVAPQVASGKLRAIAVSTAQRSAVLPEVPTLAESRLPGYDFDAWLALVGPPRLSRPLVVQASAELKAVLAQKEVQDALAAVGFRIAFGTPGQAEAFFRSERERHAALARRAGVVAE